MNTAGEEVSNELIDDWRFPENSHRRLQERPWTGRTEFQVAPRPPKETLTEPSEPEAAPAEQWSGQRSSELVERRVIPQRRYSLISFMF